MKKRSMHKRKKELKRKEHPRSSSLRRIGEYIQRRDYPAALAKASQVLGESNLSEVEEARVLSMVGDSEFKRGRFRKAAEIHLQATSKSVDHVSLWLRPYIGQVRALLKVPNVDDAVTMARHAVAVAESKMTNFDERVRLANQELAEKGTVEVPSVPPRVSVVATRMGYLFLQEGEPEVAEEFFTKAIQSAKGGANRARQGLAQIALAKGELGEAIKASRHAIRLGGFKAKTHAAWATLIAARRQLGGWKISEGLIKGLDVAPAGLRARVTLTIIRELRKNDMRQWKEVAARWIENDGAGHPKYEKEIRKLVLSSAKRMPGDLTAKRNAAEQLLSMKVMGPKDWLMGAKEWVRTSLWDNQAVDFDQLLTTAKAKYGEHFVPRAAHSLALSCMMANRHDLARPLLERNIQQCNVGSKTWCKSVWALARMENLLENYIEAAQGYRTFFECQKIPKRFTLQAQLLWVKALIKSGQSESILEAMELMTEAISEVQDPDTLMNFARQLQHGPDELKTWGRELFLQGESLALEQFNSATHPSVATAILFKMTRRQVIDFGRSNQAIELWESFDAEKQEWLWSASGVFWEYIGLVFEAYIRTGNPAQAEEFAKEFLSDPAVPAERLPYIGVPYMSWLIRHERFVEGLHLCERLTKVSPSHSQCALAWYWLTLEAYKRGDAEKSKKYAEQIRATQGVNIGLHKEWCLDAKALLLLADLNPENVDTQDLNCSREFLSNQLASLNYDLETLQ